MRIKAPLSTIAPLSTLEGDAPAPAPAPAVRPSLAEALARFVEACRVDRMLRRSKSRDGHPYRASTERDETANERLTAGRELRSAVVSRLGMVACIAAAVLAIGVVTARRVNRLPASPPDLRVTLDGGAKSLTTATARPRVRFGIQPRAVTVDINRDGTGDYFVFGEVEDAPPLGFYSVLDGKTLAPIWATAPAAHDRHPLPIVTAGKRVFFADNSGRLRVHDLATGALVSDVQTDPGWHVCRGADDATAWIATINEAVPRGIVVDTAGRTVATTPQPANCVEAWRAIDAPDRGLIKGRAWRMFETDDHRFGFELDIFGGKAADTMVLFEPKRPGGHRWRERYYLAGDEGSFFDVQAFDLDPFQFYFAYRLTDGSRRIGARSLFAGNVTWVSTSTRHQGAAIQGTTAGDDLLVVADTHAELFSKESGEARAFLRARDALPAR